MEGNAELQVQSGAAVPFAPLAPKNLLALFFAPTRFFAHRKLLPARPETLLVAWASGVAYAVDRASRGTALDAPASMPAIQWLSDSWLNFWVLISAGGVLGGFFFWFAGGWWYRLRLDWCEARNVSFQEASAAYVYQDFVMSLPVVALTVVLTLRFGSFSAAVFAWDWWFALPVVFVFWSCMTSYRAARAFGAERWPARAWFLVAPGLLYLLALGVMWAEYVFTERSVSLAM